MARHAKTKTRQPGNDYPITKDTKHMTSTEQIFLAVDQIKIDHAFNSRRIESIDKTRLAALAHDMLTNGQLTPIVVSPIPGKTPFRLLAGHRRLLALLGSVEKGKPVPQILAVVREIRDEREAFLVNVTENIARDELTKFEVANAIVRLQDQYGMSANEVRERMNVAKGFSKETVNLYTRAMRQLHPKILDAWAGEHVACTIANLNKWSALKLQDGEPDHDAQLAAFQEVAVIKAEGGEAKGGEAGDREAKGPARVSRARIEEALVAAKEAKKQGVIEAGTVIDVLKWVLGGSVKLKANGVLFFDPTAKPLDEDDDN